MAMKNVSYNLGSRCVNAILASMRMHSSQLNSHLYRNNITPKSFVLIEWRKQYFISSLNALIL